MKPIFVSTTVMFLVLVMVDSSTQLQCYECDSTKTSGCVVYGFDTNAATKRTCPPGVTQCIKIFDKIIATGVIDFVQRACGGTATVNTQCIKTGGNTLDSCTYACTSDLCNDAVTSKSFSIFTATSLLCVAFLARYI